MNDDTPSFRLLSFLLFFIFGGAIVGETTALSLVVSSVGPSILSKLYLVNGFLLFFLPVLFLNNIDRINRGRLLSIQLIVVCSLIAVYLVFFQIFSDKTNTIATWILLCILYPLSYLSKTILFVTFWTLANDICHTEAAKKGFPIIATWGFVGGLVGALCARMLLGGLNERVILVLWLAGYGCAWIFSTLISKRHQSKFLRKEKTPENFREDQGFLAQLRIVTENRLIRHIAILYFFTFIAIFSMDYLFWKQCKIWFGTSRSLASFQFSFYLTYGIVTIFGLYIFLPRAISKWGFPKIFGMLPFMLLLGAAVMILFEVLGFNSQILFYTFISFQFMRYVIFENAFAPIYQMFFAAIPIEKRGRSKTFLEGVVKPSAIMVSGLLLIIFDTYLNGILIIILVISVLMIITVFQLRRTYMHGLITRLGGDAHIDEMIAEIGSQHDQKIVSLMKGYIVSGSVDLRSLAVRILATDDSREALDNLRQIFETDTDGSIKEQIARSLSRFTIHDAKSFVEKLLTAENKRIKANALYSINKHDAPWKWELVELIKPLLDDQSTRVQIESARYLWKAGVEKERIVKLLHSLVSSENSNKVSAGMYLTGELKPDNWQHVVVEHLHTTSLQVFEKCVDTLFCSASDETKIGILAQVSRMSRRHIAIVGKVLAQIGPDAIPWVSRFIITTDNRRMIFELVLTLTHIVTSARTHKNHGDIRFSTEVERFIREWILKELKHVYYDVHVWQSGHIEAASGKRISIDPRLVIEEALRDQLFRICQLSLDVLVLLDKEGVMAVGRLDLDLLEETQRRTMIELVESSNEEQIGALVAPILRHESWELLAKKGRSVFRFETVSADIDLGYFIRSENKWVCLCALYYAGRIDDHKKFVSAHRADLFRLAADENQYVHRSAQGLLCDPDLGDKKDCMETFALLETVLFFKKTLLFRNIPAEKLMGLSEITRCMNYKKGELVSSEGEVSDQLYIVRNGSLKIVKVKNDVKTILSIIREGEAYGEIGLFNQAPRSATAIANQDCELYVIQRSAFKRLLLESPEIAYNFLEIFAEKLRRSGEEVALLHTTLSHSFKDSAAIRA